MVLVDIYVPAIDQTYDFNLDEHALISSVLEEIGEMIDQMTQNGPDRPQDIGRLVICDRRNKTILPENLTLSRCGIENGAGLLVV